MATAISILNYNNYYNRILKREETIDAYNEYITYTLDKTNFNPNDGITASHTIGANEYDGLGDYLIVTKDDVISSRWFIVEAVRNRGGQYNLKLRRDVLADYKELIMDAECFVEKGNVGFTNPLVYNKENMTLNQIKSEEYLIKDSSGCAWIVGYIPRDLEAKTNTFNPKLIPDYKFDTNINEWEFFKYISQDFKCYPNDESYFSLFFRDKSGTKQKTIRFGIDREIAEEIKTGVNLNGALYGGFPSKEQASNYFTEGVINNYFNSLFVETGIYKSKNETENLRKYDNKILAFNDGIYKVTFDVSSYGGYNTIPHENSNYKSTIYKMLEQWTFVSEGVALQYGGYIGGPAGLNAYGEVLRIKLERVETNTEDAISWSIPTAGSRAHLQDAPYDMFCMPYGETIIVDGETSFNTSAELNMGVVNDMISSLVAGTNQAEIYDVQLLPYCPLPQLVREEGSIINLSSYDSTVYYEYITKGNENTKVGAIFFLDSSSFSTEIKYFISILNPKIESNTDMYRLSSPNYNGQFEFNAAMNSGVSKFYVECTYLPYSPYIHVKPDFKGLYGANYNDARGLICGGDFSLPIVNDAWNQYKLNNKNYQSIFDRQIQNMNVQHSVARTQDIIGAITGAGTGIMAGYALGSLAGAGPIGAVVGGAMSATAGIADIALKETLRAEALDYTKDQFQFQLGNIQALPNSLTRVTSFNINNRIFPILERYTCTEVEKRALANKIAYNGMEINVIGRLSEYITEWEYGDIVSRQYVKGKIIKFDNLGEDLHIANAISDEVFKGFFNKEL